MGGNCENPQLGIMTEQLPVYILAGGKSSRFGSDKAMIQFRGRPLISHIAQTLRAKATSVTAVADVADKYQALGLRTIPDCVAGAGPIGGVLTAVEDCADQRWLLVASCDLVGVDCNWVDLLMAGRREAAAVVAFKTDRWEPLFALYHTSIHKEVRRRVMSGQGTMWKLIEAVGAVAVEAPVGLRQVNTPGDLERFLEGGGSAACG